MPRRSPLRFFAALTIAALYTTAARAADPIDEAAAKRERSVVWYTSNNIEQASDIAKMFEAKTGVHVELFRSGGSAVMSRFLQEQHAGRTAVDVLSTSLPALYAQFAHKGVLVPFKPVNFDRLQPDARDPDGYYFSHRITVMAVFARKDMLAPADVPTRWSDLADKKYAGKMVITDPSYSSLQVTVMNGLSQRLGWSYYQALRTNDTMVVRGNQQATDMLKQKERAIAIGIDDSYAVQARRQGFPLLSIYPADGTFLMPNPNGIIKGSPHPNAAKLFAQFLLSDEAQDRIIADGLYSPRLDFRAPKGAPKLTDIKAVPIDHEQVARNTKAIRGKFNEIFQ
jgi:iron(III) transport system substrate-binding protein